MNIAIIIETLQEVYGSLKEMKKALTMEFLLMLIQLIQHLLNISQVSQENQLLLIII